MFVDYLEDDMPKSRKKASETTDKCFVVVIHDEDLKVHIWGPAKWSDCKDKVDGIIATGPVTWQVDEDGNWTSEGTIGCTVMEIQCLRDLESLNASTLLVI